MKRSTFNLFAAAGLLAAGTSAFAGGQCSSAKQVASGSTCGASAQTVALGAYGGGDIVDTAVSAGSFNTLAAALEAAGLVDALKGDGPFTVFAPTDDAFAKLPKGTVETLLKPENKDQLVAILTYHVVPGRVMAADVVKLSYATTLNKQRVDIKTRDGKVMIDNATVIKADVSATNGVIHVIDRVILPNTKNIVGTAAEAGSFTTLLAAAKAAGLAELLQSEGPFTVFAPTDEAFGQLPPGTVESLLKPENKDKLANILKYHVVPGRIYAADAIKAKQAKTALGETVDISVSGKQVMVNEAVVLKADVETSNGVIHVIDKVLLP